MFEKNKSYTFQETNAYDKFRFTYFKGIGSVTFDDVTLSFTKQMNYILRDSWVANTADSISNLIPNTSYSYKLKASDKSIHYENITGYSNIISVKTLAYPTNHTLIATKDGNGNITVDLPSVGSTLYVYNLLGQCIKTIVPDRTTLQITGLPRNQLYILKSNNLVAKIAL